MTQIPNNAGEKPVLNLQSADVGLQRRIFRTMILTAVVAIGWSVLFASWQVIIGLVIGGLLSLLNHHWLQTSISAAFGVLLKGDRPRWTLSKYIFRYLVVGAVAFAAYQVGIASLPAIIVGLSTFVVALLIEALREFYFAIIRREEIG